MSRTRLCPFGCPSLENELLMFKESSINYFDQIILKFNHQDKIINDLVQKLDQCLNFNYQNVYDGDQAWQHEEEIVNFHDDAEYDVNYDAILVQEPFDETVSPTISNEDNQFRTAVELMEDVVPLVEDANQIQPEEALLHGIIDPIIEDQQEPPTSINSVNIPSNGATTRIAEEQLRKLEPSFEQAILPIEDDKDFRTAVELMEDQVTVEGHLLHSKMPTVQSVEPTVEDQHIIEPSTLASSITPIDYRGSPPPIRYWKTPFIEATLHTEVGDVNEFRTAVDLIEFVNGIQVSVPPLTDTCWSEAQLDPGAETRDESGCSSALAPPAGTVRPHGQANRRKVRRKRRRVYSAENRLSNEGAGGEWSIGIAGMTSSEIRLKFSKTVCNLDGTDSVVCALCPKIIPCSNSYQRSIATSNFALHVRIVHFGGPVNGKTRKTVDNM